jgi:hypothetical protein
VNSGLKIKQIIAPSGEWFRIQIEHLPERKAYLVRSRVCAWAVMTYDPPSPDRITDWIEGVDSCLYGHVDEDLHQFYVHGEDLAPNGKSWLTVFNETPSFNWGLKDISELAGMIDSRAKLVPSQSAEAGGTA